MTTPDVRAAISGSPLDVRLRMTCLGSGVIGRSWAIVFARAGWDVTIYDLDDQALRRARDFLTAYAGTGHSRIDGDGGGAFLNRVHFSASLPDAVRSAAYVQESIVEDATSKRTLLEDVGRHAADECLIASSTSSLPGREFMLGVVHPERCLVAHPLNPPHVLPVVELCPTPLTSPATIEAATRVLERVGQAPIVLRREVPGFVVNRLQIALLAEALHLVGEGVCSAADVDRAVLRGLAVRWAIIGPLGAGHLNGDDGYAAYMHKYAPAIARIAADLCARYPISDALIDTIDKELRERYGDDVRALQDRRDAAVAALMPHLNGLQL